MAHKWAYRLFPIFYLLNIPVLLWYAHGTVTPHLRRALRAVDRVVTSTAEGFRIPTPKLHLIGQGINTELFKIPKQLSAPNEIIYIGRLSRRKRIHLLLETLRHLHDRGERDLKLVLVGPLLSSDDTLYKAEVDAQIQRLGLTDAVSYRGSQPQETHPALYQNALVHLSFSETGSMDKTLLEALACGCPVMTSNVALAEILAAVPGSYLANAAPVEAAERIQQLRRTASRPSPEFLRSLIVGKHDEQHYVQELLRHLKDLYGRYTPGHGYLSA
jgi:glycosyltransferase involved in cell wall biosynthesis